MPDEEFDAAVADWAGKLAAKSPVIMRLGKEAMRRQMDMPLDDALDYLRAQLTLALSTEDIVEGVTAFFEKREPQWKGADEHDPRQPPATARCCARSSRTCRRAAQRIRLGGGEEKIAASTRARSSPRASASRCSSTRARFVELGIHGRPHFSQRAMDGVDAPADGVITGYGKVDGRLTAVCAYDFTVMAGSMGMTGEIKVTRLRELALTKRIPFVWLLDSAGARVQEAAGAALRRLRAPLPRGGHHERRHPAGRRADGAVRRRHRLHPRPRRLRADGQGPRLDGARRTAPRARRHRRGRHPGGTRRLARALPQVRRRRHGGGSDEECIVRIKQYLSYMPQNCEERPPLRARGRQSDPIDRARGGAPRRAARVQPQAL